jgi:hypothetical protein
MSESHSPNPFEMPLPRGIRILQGSLRVIVAVQCWGWAAGRLDQQRSSPLSGLVERAYQLGPEALGRLDDAVACALILCGVVVLLRPMTPVLIPVILWQLLWVVGTVVPGIGESPAWEPARQAAGIMAPLALMLIDFWPPRIKPSMTLTRCAMFLLRQGTFVTFAAYGIVTLQQALHGGSDLELLRQSVHKLTQRELVEELARPMLAGIGAVNIALALCLVSSRNRAIALLMTVWGLAAAFSHTVADGRHGYDVTMTLFANGGAPLTLFLYWTFTLQERPPALLPEREGSFRTDS